MLESKKVCSKNVAGGFDSLNSMIIIFGNIISKKKKKKLFIITTSNNNFTTESIVLTIVWKTELNRPDRPVQLRIGSQSSPVNS